jgi:hypothetical protein
VQTSGRYQKSPANRLIRCSSPRLGFEDLAVDYVGLGTQPVVCPIGTPGSTSARSASRGPVPAAPVMRAGTRRALGRRWPLPSPNTDRPAHARSAGGERRSLLAPGPRTERPLPRAGRLPGVGQLGNADCQPTRPSQSSIDRREARIVEPDGLCGSRCHRR